MFKRIQQALYWIDRSIEWLTAWALVIAVIAMVTISVLSIVLRWFSITYIWFQPLVRHVVFLTAFLGGVLATGRGNHIGIDILGKYLENHNRKKELRWLKIFIAFVSTMILIWLIFASWKFLQIEWQYGKEVFWGIHSSFLVGIIPFGFALIAYRFFYRFIHELCCIAPEEETAEDYGKGIKPTLNKHEESK